MEEITKYMTIIKKDMHSFLNEAFKPYNLSGTEAPFVHEFAKKKKCRQTDLTKALECDKAYTHRIVGKLLTKNIIQPVENESQWFELTAQGDEMVCKICSTLKSAATKLKQGLSNEEEQTLLNILKKVALNASQLKQGDL